MIPVPGRKGAAVSSSACSSRFRCRRFPMPLPSFSNPAVGSARRRPPRFNVIDTSVTVASIAPEPAGEAGGSGHARAAEAAASLAGPPASRPLVTDVIGAWLSDSYSSGRRTAPLGATRPSAPLVPPVGVGADGGPSTCMTSGSISAAEAAEVPASRQAMPETLADKAAQRAGSFRSARLPPRTAPSRYLAAPRQSMPRSMAFRPLSNDSKRMGRYSSGHGSADLAISDDANAMCKQIEESQTEAASRCRANRTNEVAASGKRVCGLCLE